MTTIEQIKEALKAHIAEADAATPGPWEVHDKFQAEHTICAINTNQTCAPLFERCGKEDDAVDAIFIAHARTMSPLVCRGYLRTIEWLEFDAINDQTPIGRLAKSRLEVILLEWHNSTPNHP